MTTFSTSMAPVNQCSMYELISDSIQTVTTNASDEWKNAVIAIVGQICRDKHEFTTDDVWAEVAKTDLKVHNNKAMCAPILYAQSEKWCEKIENFYIKSKRKECHGRPIQVWRSLLFTNSSLLI